MTTIRVESKVWLQALCGNFQGRWPEARQVLRRLPALIFGVTVLGSAHGQLTPVAITPPHLGNADAGTLPGGFAVAADGSASYSIPIEVPPGTAGMAPKLSLNYSSQGSNGMVGLGWSLGGLPSIHRCSKTIAQDGVSGRISLDNADRLCLSGQRLVLATPNANPADDNAYWSERAQYRTENESFTRVTRDRLGGFKAETKDGSIQYFGNDSGSLIVVPGSRGGNQALFWALGRIEDRVGNFMTVQYNRDGVTGEYSPAQVSYGGHAGPGTDLAVRFSYEGRGDAQTMYMGGARNDLRTRLSHVQTYIRTASDGTGGALVRDYAIHYASSGNTGRSLVDWVQACAINPQTSVSECLPKTTFQWGDAGPPSLRTSANFSVPYFVGTYADRLYHGDIEGRGRQAFVDAKTAKICGFGIIPCDTPNLSTEDKKVWTTFTGAVLIQLADGRTISRSLPGVYYDRSGVTGMMLADVDGDGRDDLILTSTIPGFSSVTDICLAIPTSNNEVGFRCLGWQNYMPYPYPEGSLPSLVDMRNDKRMHLLFGPTQDCYYNGTAMQCDTRQLIDTTPAPIYGGLAANQFFRPTGLELSKQDVSDLYSVWKNHPNPNYEGVTVCVNKQAITCQTVFQAVSPTWQSGAPPLPTLGDAGIADLNGDGLTDFVYIVDDVVNVCLSKETGVDCKVVPSPWGGGPRPKTASGVGVGQGIGDYLGDGVPRWLFHVSPNYPDPTGTTTWLCRWADTQFACQQIAAGATAGGLGNFDSDGSGVVSFAYRTAGDTTVATNPAIAYSYYSLASQDRIVAATNGVGYREEVDYARGDDATAYRYLPVINGVEQRSSYPLVSRSPGVMVKQLRRSTGQGGFLHTNYHYEGAVTDASGRGSGGFAQMQATDDLGITTTTTYSQSFPFAGIASAARTVGPTGGELSNTQHMLDKQLLSLGSGAQTQFAFVKQSVTAKHDLDGSDMGTATVVNTYGDGWGNLTDQTTTTVGAGKTFTTRIFTGYSNDAAAWLLGRPTLVGTTRSDPISGSLTRTVNMSYDPSTGLLATETIETDPRYTVMTTYDRSANPFGLVNKKIQNWVDPYSGTTLFRTLSDVTYDGFGRFPFMLRNALNHTETRGYDPGSGAQVARIDANNLATTWTIDGFGRVSRELHADGTDQRRYAKVCQADCPANAVVATITDNFYGTSRTTVPHISYTDSAGHGVQELSYGFDGRAIVADKRYDALGRLSETDQPRFSGDTAYLDMRQDYDPLGRAARTTTRDEFGMDLTSTTLYQGLVSVLINPKTQIRTDTRDVLGQLVQVRDAKLGVTQFTYEPFGALATTVDPNGNVISVSYDLLGRKTDLRDPNLGWIHYDVDPPGRTWRQVSSKQRVAGKSTRMEFDMLDRMTGRYETDLESHWVFDATSWGVGQLAEAYTGAPALRDYRRQHTYDSLGRLSTTTLLLSDGSYTDRTDYDTWARLTHKAYMRQAAGPPAPPKGYGWRYNAYGYVYRIERDDGTALWQATGQDAAQRVTQASLGNGLAEAHAYSPNSGRLVSSQLTNSSNVARLQEGYQYDGLGNVTQRSQSWDASGFQESFGYDELNRLTSSQVANQGLKAFTYDAAGNLQSKTGVGVGNYVYPAQGSSAVLPHAVQSIPGIGSFGYDGNGNLQSGAGRTLSWTSFDMPVLITKGGASSAFVYGPDHQRARQTRSDGLVTVYAGAQEVENRSGQITLKTYWPMGIGVEIDRPNQATELNWTHTDRLGSPVALTDQSGNFREQLGYDSWGKRRTTDGSATPDSLDGVTDNRGFTGHEMLDLLDLVHMNGRVYDPLVARFVSGDPVVQDPTNGQNYSRYSYVLNNPTNLTDPTGFADEDPDHKQQVRDKRDSDSIYSHGVNAARAPDALFSTSSASNRTDQKDAANTSTAAKGGGSVLDQPVQDRFARTCSLAQVGCGEAQRESYARFGWQAERGGLETSSPESWLLGAGGSIKAGLGLVAKLFERDALEAAAKEAGIVANGIRGRASEARVLNELGLAKNTTAVSTAEGRSIPDALTRSLSVEVKDAANVSLTRQLRIQTEAARASGRESVLITGENTCVSGACSRAFDTIIRRPDLGPR